MAVQRGLVAECEGRNRRAREEVGRMLYVSAGYVKAMRSMDRFKGVFIEGFERANEEAMQTAVGCSCRRMYLWCCEWDDLPLRGAFVLRGSGAHGGGNIYYLRMLEVLEVVVFTVTIGSQLTDHPFLLPA